MSRRIGEHYYNRVTRGYFETMGISSVSGRPIDARDAQTVAVVNQAFAVRFWPGADALGRRVQINGRALTVIGVVADGKYEFTAPRDPLQLVPAIQRAARDVDSRLSVMSPSTLESYTSVPYIPIGLASSLLSIMGVAALVRATLARGTVAAVAALIPATSAARVSPTVALREE